MQEIKESVQKMSRDLKQASVTLSAREARFLVDTYYNMQDNRIRAANQCRQMTETAEPHVTLAFVAEQAETLERTIKSALDTYSSGNKLGEWAKDQYGIGPVIAAGLLAYIDLTKAPTVGHIWSYAGLIPGQVRKKGVKINWNPALKRLAWIMGESFVKVSGREAATYGKLYVEGKAKLIAANEQFFYADQCKEILASKKFGRETEAYKYYSAGMLPPAHVHARAKRWAVKLFLSHYHEVGRNLLGLPVPAPYAIDILKHAHLISPKATDDEL